MNTTIVKLIKVINAKVVAIEVQDNNYNYDKK